MDKDVLHGTNSFGGNTIEVTRGNDAYIKCESVAYCTIFGKRYEAKAYDDDINVSIYNASKKLFQLLTKTFS